MWKNTTSLDSAFIKLKKIPVKAWKKEQSSVWEFMYKSFTCQSLLGKQIKGLVVLLLVESFLSGLFWLSIETFIKKIMKKLFKELIE